MTNRPTEAKKCIYVMSGMNLISLCRLFLNKNERHVNGFLKKKSRKLEVS